mmetsp:Transcript_19459/g.25651  ORF Transcript_19459/g.25651 Transcript_19459/m.25651 type:complete len:204 (-) Transcript_19459:322-933(-)
MMPTEDTWYTVHMYHLNTCAPYVRMKDSRIITPLSFTWTPYHLQWRDASLSKSTVWILLVRTRRFKLIYPLHLLPHSILTMKNPLLLSLHRKSQADTQHQETMDQWNLYVKENPQVLNENYAPPPPIQNYHDPTDLLSKVMSRPQNAFREATPTNKDVEKFRGHFQIKALPHLPSHANFHPVGLEQFMLDEIAEQHKCVECWS